LYRVASYTPQASFAFRIFGAEKPPRARALRGS
jgi:hypothetical protein